MVKGGGEIKVINYARVSNKEKQYVSELKLNKVRDISEGELLRLKMI